MMSYRDGLKLGFEKLDPMAALRAPISILLGVTPEAETTLQKLGLTTVYDLATSSLFRGAADVFRATDAEGDSIIARMGRISGGFIDANGPTSPAALMKTDIAMLREITDELAGEIKDHLQVEIVGDLGRWPAFRAAQTILEEAMPSLKKDQEEASEFVPKFGEYPTERHYYRSLVIDHVKAAVTTDLAIAGPIDISPTASETFGFSAPAVGAILTFSQSWFAHGVTLGNLLHSVALAPGESTRIAVMDWARRTSASGQENISESEKLTNASTHTRAISEVQDAVANEVQSGFSKSSGSSTTSAGGGGFGLSLGPLTLGGSGSSGTTTTNAESFTSSAGSRNLSASMNQRISDSTQQAASSVRERRASIVKEVSESEHQTVSSRIIANYNHMHALTVQYYEVIEIYRMNVQLQQVERCLFIPMKLIHFTDEIVERYRGVLADAALNQRARALLSNEFGVVNIQSILPVRRFDTVFDRLSGVDRVALRAARMSTDQPETPETPAEPAPAPAPAPSILTAPIPMSWIQDEIFRASRITMVNVLKFGKTDLSLPGDVELSGLSFSVSSPTDVPVTLSGVQLALHSGNSIPFAARNPVEWTIVDPTPLQEINEIRISTASPSKFLGKMTLQLTYGGARFPLSIPVEINANAMQQPLCRMIPNDTSAELRTHLEKHRLHYSQAIWRSLDASSVALLVSGFTFENMPVVDLIDPNPIMVAGNYLVFRMPGYVEAVGVFNPPGGEEGNTPEAAARKNWKTWLNEKGLVLGAQTGSEQIIPIPTGGVFAEAVLGRSNSAEKLDATRFWNWQDSPIPLQPPEIAAIQMESRAQPIDVTPGQLGAPVVNIMNPTPLPDPTGVGSIIGAIQNGNMFRDMSGLSATAGLAQSLASNATSASTEAGRQAAANLAVAAQKDIEEKRIAAQLAMAAMGLPAGNSGSAKNISESGALLNTATAMDKQSPKTGSSTSSGPSGIPTGESGGGGSTDGSFMPGPPEGGIFNNPSGNSRADDVMSKMTWGNLGTAGSSLVLASSGQTTTPGKSGLPAIIIYELAIYASFPRPWPDDATEIKAIQNDIWQPAAEDFDAMSKAATSATQATKPYGQTINTLEDILSTVNYFAPSVPGFNTTHPSRVKRLNLFFYSGGQNLEFSGTINTNGTRVSVFGPTVDLKSSVVDLGVISNVLNNTANNAALAKLKTAWAAGAEIWLYSAGGVPDDALAEKFAKLMGATVRAFDEPFWVLPRFDAVQNTISSRDEFGIGADFSAASARRTKVLHKLDALATRTFPP